MENIGLTTIVKQLATKNEEDSKSLPYATLANDRYKHLKNLDEVNAEIFEKLAGYQKLVISGVRGLHLQTGAWGRSLLLPSREIFQLRISPMDLTQQNPDVILIATRVTGAKKTAKVAILIAYRTEKVQTLHGSLAVDDKNLPTHQPTRAVACEGLFVLPISLFSRHDPFNRSLPTNRLITHDPSNYLCVCSATFSIFNGSSQNLDKNADHKEADLAYAFTSHDAITRLARGEASSDILIRRMTQPINLKEFKKLTNVTSETDEERKLRVTVDCATDLLSPNSIVSIKSNTFFTGAIPEKLELPNGFPLMLAFSLRLATYPAHFHLKIPSAVDKAANDRIRGIFESSPAAPPLPVNGKYFRIDVVMRAALRACEFEVAKIKKIEQLPENMSLNVITDSLTHFQRIGQVLMTNSFGLGSSITRHTDEFKYSNISRLHDYVDCERDRFLVNSGEKLEGIYLPRINLATTAQRRDAILHSLFDVEHYLLTGKYGGHVIATSNDTLDYEEAVVKTMDVFGEIICNNGPHAPRQAAENILATNSFNLNAMIDAATEIKNYLLRGSSTAFKDKTTATLATGTTPCSECDTPIDATFLMMPTAYSTCSACNAPRCLECCNRFQNQILSIEQPGKVGSRCRQCGASPAHVEFSIDADGTPLAIKISERTRDETPTAMHLPAPNIKMKDAKEVRETRAARRQR